MGERKMVEIWEKVLQGRQVGVNTPFVAYGGHSLTAVQLCSAVVAEFGKRPDLLFLTSADCTVRELLKKFERSGAEKHHRFFLWGDSLGAVLAYEFACRLEQSSTTSVMGLFVSGNAGPAVASAELGIGETVQLPRGPCSSAFEMDEEDWKQFLLLSSGSDGLSGELARILDDPALAPGVIGPVRADCLAYESYHLSKTVRLSMPIFTMCGANDCIATPQVLKTWKDVAKGRIEHMIIPRSGHRIAQECPGEVANMLHLHSLPSFVDELHTFRSYRAAYRLLR